MIKVVHPTKQKTYEVYGVLDIKDAIAANRYFILLADNYGHAIRFSSLENRTDMKVLYKDEKLDQNEDLIPKKYSWKRFGATNPLASILDTNSSTTPLLKKEQEI